MKKCIDHAKSGTLKTVISKRHVMQIRCLPL